MSDPSKFPDMAYLDMQDVYELRIEELETQIEKLETQIEKLEQSALLMFNAILALPEDAMGIAPEQHDCPAYPIRNEVLNNAIPPIRHLIYDNAKS